MAKTIIQTKDHKLDNLIVVINNLQGVKEHMEEKADVLCILLLAKRRSDLKVKNKAVKRAYSFINKFYAEIHGK